MLYAEVKAPLKEVMCDYPAIRWLNKKFCAF